MPITVPTLPAALSSIGNAHVYVGDPFTLNGMTSLGMKEGDISVTFADTFSELKAPELTGDAVHQATAMGSGVTGTIPLIVDTAGTLYSKISPLGTKGGGYSNPQAVVPTAMLILPDIEAGSSFGYNGTVWTPAAPVHALWFWRVMFGRAQESFSYQNGGKKIITVPFTAMFATNAGIPEGQKLWTRGDPVAQAISTLRI